MVGVACWKFNNQFCFKYWFTFIRFGLPMHWRLTKKLLRSNISNVSMKIDQVAHTVVAKGRWFGIFPLLNNTLLNVQREWVLNTLHGPQHRRRKNTQLMVWTSLKSKRFIIPLSMHKRTSCLGSGCPVWANILKLHVTFLPVVAMTQNSNPVTFLPVVTMTGLIFWQLTTHIAISFFNTLHEELYSCFTSAVTFIQE